MKLKLLIVLCISVLYASENLLGQIVLKNSGGSIIGTPDGHVIAVGCSGTVFDYDGNVYRTVLIGSQCWLGKNLNVTHYADGTAISYVTTAADWLALSPTSIACADNGDRSTYGLLYTWAAAMKGAASSTTGIQGVCPNGWHLPSQAEWDALASTFTGSSVAGGALKETGTTHWQTPNTGATNSSSFFGIAAGDRSTTSGNPSSAKSYGNFWSTEEASSDHAYYRYLSYNNGILGSSDFPKKIGFSVRCTKN